MAHKILVVDDDRDWVELIVLMLSRLGYECGKACDGEQAVDAIQASSPDLIVLDDMMPSMSGPEVVRWLRADSATKDIPVIFVPTRAISEAEQQKISDGGPLIILMKPFTPDAFVAVVRELLPL